MDKKKITIVTGTGGILGTGHMQRMLNLAVCLNRTDNFSAEIYLSQNEYSLPGKFSGLITDSISSKTDLIIRDMRDSTAEEINQLKHTAPALVIDDSGDGKYSADYSINLLPAPDGNNYIIKPDASLFLFGYNFAEGIRSLNEKKSIRRDIDIAVYAGFDPSDDLISSVIKSIPDNASSVLLTGGDVKTLSGRTVSTGLTYPEILPRTKIIITHFGLTMFEAHACGCRIAALNPSPYHTILTGFIQSDFDIRYLSEYGSFSSEGLSEILHGELKKIPPGEISIPEILNKINSGTEKFIEYIEKILLRGD